jgi:hypothetical protein
LRVDDLSPRMIDQMRQENQLDQLLWETWKDADQAKTGARSLQFYEPSLPEFAARETLRFVSQVRRRFHRGWKLRSGGNLITGTTLLPQRR